MAIQAEGQAGTKAEWQARPTELGALGVRLSQAELPYLPRQQKGSSAVAYPSCHASCALGTLGTCQRNKPSCSECRARQAPAVPLLLP